MPVTGDTSDGREVSPATPSTTTSAIQIVRHGLPEVLVEKEISVGEPGPAEVHVRVLVAGVNFADLLMRAGLYGTVPPIPYSPGFEIAGPHKATLSLPGLIDTRTGSSDSRRVPHCMDLSLQRWQRTPR